MSYEREAYIRLTDVIGIPRNNLKDFKAVIVIVFGIEVDTTKFIARVPKDRLEQAQKATSKTLASDSVALLDIQSLVGFLSFCAKAVRLGWVFMRRLWDIVAYSYPRTAPTTTKQRIPSFVRHDLMWWNRFLPEFNGVLFFDESQREEVTLYRDAILDGLGGFFYKNNKKPWDEVQISQHCAFASRISQPPEITSPKDTQDPANREIRETHPDINMHEVEAVHLAFQTFASQ